MERPVFRAGDPGCQADQDAYVAEQERLLAKHLDLTCEACGNGFSVTLGWLAQQPGSEVRAPSRCRACRER